MSYLDSAIQVLEKVKSPARQAEFYRNKGILQKNHGDLEQSLITYEQALKLFEKAKDHYGIAATYNNIGISYFRMGYQAEALQYYVKAHDLNEYLQNDEGLIKNCIAIGNFHYSKHDYLKALDAFHEAEKLLEAYNDLTLSALVNKNIGVIYSQHKFDGYDPSLAINYYNRSIGRFHQINDVHNISGLYNNIALIYENQNELDSALWYYLKSERLSGQIGAVDDLARTLFNRGNVFLKQNRYDSAELLFYKSLVLAQEKSNVGLERNSAKKLALIHSRKDLSKSLEYFMLYDSLDTELFNKEKERIIHEMNAKYETEKKNKELAQAQIEIERKTAERDGFLITLAVFLALMIILVLIYQQRQKAIIALNQKEKVLFDKRVDELLLEQELNSLNALMDGQEQERKRISRELHDRVGSLLTAMKFSLESADVASQVKKLLTDALNETRNLSHSLASGVLAKFGLVAAISDLKTSIESDRKVAVEFIPGNLNQRINNDVEIDLYRIVQELVSNSLKHSFAKHITIHLQMNDQLVQLVYEDDGVGFSTDQTGLGIGLKNIEARVQKHHGELDIQSVPGKGMHLTLNLACTYEEAIINS